RRAVEVAEAVAVVAEDLAVIDPAAGVGARVRRVGGIARVDRVAVDVVLRAVLVAVHAVAVIPGVLAPVAARAGIRGIGRAGSRTRVRRVRLADARVHARAARAAVGVAQALDAAAGDVRRRRRAQRLAAAALRGLATPALEQRLALARRGVAVAVDRALTRRGAAGGGLAVRRADAVEAGLARVRVAVEIALAALLLEDGARPLHADLVDAEAVGVLHAARRRDLVGAAAQRDEQRDHAGQRAGGQREGARCREACAHQSSGRSQ